MESEGKSMADNPMWAICERVAEVQTFEATPTGDEFKDWLQESICLSANS
jgi:hypothetical protein